MGDDYAAQAYERRVRRLAEELGCHYTSETLAPDVEHADALAVVGKLNADPRVSGILVLRPLPPQVSEASLYRTLDPLKDVEAVHPDNAGLLALGEPRFTPSTPAAIFFLLDRYVEGRGGDPATFYNGLDLVLVGRSNNVGKPALWLGLARGATVVSCHHFTSQAGRLAEHTLRADIVIVAAGVPGVVTGEMVKEGVIAVDVGINAGHGPGYRQDQAGRRPRLRERRGEGGGDHPGSGRRRPDHRRLAPPEYGRGGALPRRALKHA